MTSTERLAPPGTVPTAPGDQLLCSAVALVCAARRDPDGATWRANLRIVIDAAEPVFAGHYPGHPILPGMYLVEYALRAARLAAPAALGPLCWESLESARFHAPVLPADVLDAELSWVAGSGAVTCTARITGADRPRATIRLRYRVAAR